MTDKMNTSLITVGERFGFIIKHLKISNKELCKEVGITQQYLSALKKQNKLTDTIVKIANIKNINLNWLVYGVGGMFLGNNVSTGVEGKKELLVPIEPKKTRLKFEKQYERLEAMASCTENGLSELKKIIEDASLKLLDLESVS